MSEEMRAHGDDDGSMTTDEWFDKTLMLTADDDDERMEYETFKSVLKRQFKAKYVHSLRQLTQLQMEQAAAEAVGENGKKGLAHQALRYLGQSFNKHEPPTELQSEGMGAAHAAQAAQLKFGRHGKTGVNSNESNFPESMIPSSKAKTLIASEITIPADLDEWLRTRCAQYSERHKMPQDVTIDIARKMHIWAVHWYGLSPVRIICLSLYHHWHIPISCMQVEIEHDMVLWLTISSDV